MITVVGSFVVDLMSRTPHMPVAGETVLGVSVPHGPGRQGRKPGRGCCPLRIPGEYGNQAGEG